METPSDWLALSNICVDIIAIIVGGYIAYWVVGEIQKNIDKESKLREYFTTELINLKGDFLRLIADIYTQRFDRKDFRARINTLSSRETILNRNIAEMYIVEDEIINLVSELNYTTSTSPEFENPRHGKLMFSDETKRHVRDLEVKLIDAFTKQILNLYKQNIQ